MAKQAPFVPPLSGSWRSTSLWLAGICGERRRGEVARKHVTEERPNRDPFSLAMEWVAKITTVGLEMVLPAVGGKYLDGRLGTSHWVLVGMVLGFIVGFWHLLQMTRPPGKGGKNQ